MVSKVKAAEVASQEQCMMEVASFMIASGIPGAFMSLAAYIVGILAFTRILWVCDPRGASLFTRENTWERPGAANHDTDEQRHNSDKMAQVVG